MGDRAQLLVTAMTKTDPRLVLTEEDFEIKTIIEDREFDEYTTLGTLVDAYGREASVYTVPDGYDPSTLKVTWTRLETPEERDARVKAKQDLIERHRLAQIERQRRKDEKARLEVLKKDEEWKEFQRLKKKFKGVA